jgi:dynein heavy chain
LSGPAGEITVPNNPTDWIPTNQWPDFYRQFYGAGLLDSFKNIQEHFMAHSD